MLSSPTTRSCTLFAYAAATTAATLCLVCLGGLVTSKGVGMAVPDWPTSYGYNMFLFPPSQWIGGVFDEHVHRLAASTVGFMTVILAFWLHFGQPAVILRRLGWAALALVLGQGLLGGLRVVMDSRVVAGTTLGVLFGLAHACAGQGFLCLLSVLTFRLSPWWGSLRRSESGSGARASWLRAAAPAATLMIFVQLLLGATMRHQHSGLAVHDFPKAYGQWWPATDAASLDRYNHERSEEDAVTAFQIEVHMLHRLGALLALASVGGFALASRRRLGPGAPVARVAAFWAILLMIQATLGAFTVLGNKPADVATAHVAVGALSLATGCIVTLMAWKTLARGEVLEPAPAPWPGPARTEAAL